MLFRNMEIKDLDRVVEIENEAFNIPWSKDAFEHEITANKLARYFVIEVEGEVVSYCGMWLILDEAHITNIAAALKHRRKGYTKTLMRKIEEYLKENKIENATLEVRVSNEKAISMYHGLGYKDQGVRPKYYVDNGEDALIMWKAIK